MNKFRLEIGRSFLTICGPSFKNSLPRGEKKNQTCSGGKEAFHFWKNLIPAVSANVSFEDICSSVFLLSLGGALNTFFFLFFHNYFVLDIANLHIRTVPFTITSTRLWGFKHFAMKNWGSLPKFHDMFLKISHEINNMFVPEISLFSELSLFTTHSRSFPDFYMSLNSSGSSYF